MAHGEAMLQSQPRLDASMEGVERRHRAVEVAEAAGSGHVPF